MGQLHKQVGLIIGQIQMGVSSQSWHNIPIWTIYVEDGSRP